MPLRIPLTATPVSDARLKKWSRWAHGIKGHDQTVGAVQTVEGQYAAGAQLTLGASTNIFGQSIETSGITKFHHF